MTCQIRVTARKLVAQSHWDWRLEFWGCGTFGFALRLLLRNCVFVTSLSSNGDFRG